MQEGSAAWQRDSVRDAWIMIDPPQVDGLRLYSLIPTVSGTLADWKADLPRIRGMGFNAIHLLPITSLDASESPYSASDLFAIDWSYLSVGSQADGLTQFEEFIAAAKALDIRLCFDLVLNHVGVTSAIARTAPDWIVPDENQPDGLQRARYWSSQGWDTWNDLVLINYEHPSESIRSEIWAYMTEYALFWANYADETGGFVRFDNLHSSDPDFMRALTAEMHAAYPGLGILAEYFTDERTLLSTGQEWGLNLILATPWNFKYVPQLREYLAYIHRVAADIRYYMPITSHDSGSPSQEFGVAESTIPRYVAAALLGTGATGMVQGVEYGESQKIDFIGRKPRIIHHGDPRFAGVIGRVNAILADYSAFRRGNNCQFVDNGHHAIIAAFRRYDGMLALGFLVVCNFDISGEQQISIDLRPILETGGPAVCRDLLTGEMHVFPQSPIELVLGPCAAQVLMFFRSANP
jgi:starch synthase (maltosyl-transferring)